MSFNFSSVPCGHGLELQISIRVRKKGDLSGYERGIVVSWWWWNIKLLERNLSTGARNVGEKKKKLRLESVSCE